MKIAMARGAGRAGSCRCCLPSFAAAHPARVPRSRAAPLLRALHSDLQTCLRSFGRLARMARGGRAALRSGGAGRGAHLGALPGGAGGSAARSDDPALSFAK